MPSKKKNKQNNSFSAYLSVFFPQVLLVLILWVLYRALIVLPVWFDESISKAVFFGIPVWLFVTISGQTSIIDTFAYSKMKRGVLIGIAFGGIFGFLMTIISIIQSQAQIYPAWLFSVDEFWWNFLLALMTAFWETLFFYSFIMTMIDLKFKKSTLLVKVVMTAIIFVIFHIPNTILRTPQFEAVIFQIILLFLFAVGQGYLFAQDKNAYSLVFSHAIWGMVLLLH